MTDARHPLPLLPLEEPAPSPAGLVPDPKRRFAPFPLTDVQEVYRIGRPGAFDNGRSFGTRYWEIDGRSLDVGRLEDALDRMLDRHDMLHAVILPDGQQQVLEQIPRYRISTVDVRGQELQQPEAFLEAIRGEMLHQTQPTDRGPPFEIRAVIFDDDRVRLYVALGALNFDAWSIHVFFTEWARFYLTPDWNPPPIRLSFRDCVVAERSKEAAERYRGARDYWRQRVSELPLAPTLPTVRSDHSRAVPLSTRRHLRLDPDVWDRLRRRAERAGLTEVGILLAAYAEVLGFWGAGRQFTLSAPQLDRPPLHPAIKEVIGQFASCILLEIDNRGNESFARRARRHEERLREGIGHSALCGAGTFWEPAGAPRDRLVASMPVAFTFLTGLTSRSSGDMSEAVSDLGSIVYVIDHSSCAWLDNQVYEMEGGLECDWDSVDEFYPAGVPAAMLEAYEQLLRLLADDADAWQARWLEQADQLRLAENRGSRAETNRKGAGEASKRIRVYVHENLLRTRPEIKLEDATQLIESGIIDSVGVAELVVFLESEFGLAIADDEITEANFATIADMVRLVSTKGGDCPGRESV